jgi:NADPH:quinone reductase-like Zn-dependent oxidoreductase
LLVTAQIAKVHGARVIATSSSDAKLARLVEMGLAAKEDTFNYKTTAKWGKASKTLTPGGIGVDHVIEIGGQGTVAEAVEAVRPDGEIVIIGLVAGIHPEKGIDPMRVLGGRFNVRGVLVGPKSQLQELVDLFAQHPTIKPVVDRVFTMAEAKAAYQFLQSGQHFGKIVITMCKILESKGKHASDRH